MSFVQYVTICEQVPWNISPKDLSRETVFERVPIKKETVIDLVKSGLSLVRFPTKIFIGPQELFEITGDYRWAKISGADQTQLYFENIYRHHGTIFGVDLIIIPHMKGVLII